MGNETILYYVFEETITGCRRNVKTYFWRKIKPLSFVVEKDELTVVTLMIPSLEKGWEREKLLGTIKEGLRKYPDYIGNAEAVIQPGLQQILMQTQDPLNVFWKLANVLVNNNYQPSNNFKTKKRTPEAVVLLTGNTIFPEEQIERFTDMMQPYFSYINHLNVMYDVGDEGEGMEETIDELMDMLYYEYGLVGRVWNNTGYKLNASDFGNIQCPVLFLDYGYQGQLPYSLMKNGGIYIDLLSTEEKERRINKKCSKISYMSPLKYLDTMVKSGYDKLVN